MMLNQKSDTKRTQETLRLDFCDKSEKFWGVSILEMKQHLLVHYFTINFKFLFFYTIFIGISPGSSILIFCNSVFLIPMYFINQSLNVNKPKY